MVKIGRWIIGLTEIVKDIIIKNSSRTYIAHLRLKAGWAQRKLKTDTAVLRRNGKSHESALS